jgi:hypothetical protein
MRLVKSAVSGESKENIEIRPLLIELMMEKAHTFGFWRRGAQVYEAKEAIAPVMTMHEFVYYAIVPYDQNLELASLLFEARDIDRHAAERLASHADDMRFPIRPNGPPALFI